MFHRRSIVKGSLSFSNPAVRAWLFQILAVIVVVSIAVYLIHNTINNLNNSGITSGFSFLDRSAGFGIVQHLIDYEQGDTYGRVFIVGLLNTLLVSALCIVFASILGFFLGLARLSDNWLLRKLSTIYIETFRNIPPLLQIFFWYFAVLRNLPGPRQAVNALDLMFLSNRGLYIPAPQIGEGFFAFCGAVIIAIVVTIGLFRYNRMHQTKTGQLRRTWPTALALIVLLPMISQWLFGAALHWDIPALRGFNFRGGMVLIPELAALTLALSATKIDCSCRLVDGSRSGLGGNGHAACSRVCGRRADGAGRRCRSSGGRNAGALSDGLMFLVPLSDGAGAVSSVESPTRCRPARAKRGLPQGARLCFS